MASNTALVDPGVKELRTVEAPDNVALMFERLAKDPTVDVEKFERLMAMQERILAYNAKAAFDAAFADMQGEIPVITEKGQIVVKGELRSKYATNEDIQETVKPILQRHGFSLRFRNEVLEAGRLKVIGILSHRGGHSERDEFITKADDSGAKNDIQAIGSARSYGQRYTTTALLNIATRGADDDGHGTTPPKKNEPATPAGYDNWLVDLETVAAEGMARFADVWNKSKDEHRKYLASTAPKHLASIKTKAANVKVAK